MAADLSPLDEGRRRRWSQFTLRTLALAMLVACVGAAWLGACLRLVSERERAIAQLLSDGFSIAFASDEDGFAFGPSPGAHARLRLRQVSFISFGNPTQTVIFSHFTFRPDSLRIQGAAHGLADRAVESILKFPEVSGLSLACVAIEDRHVARLSALRNLDYLDLAETRVTDGGLAPLAEMPRLESLSLESNAITNAAIPTLASLPNLARLRLYKTAVDFNRVSKEIETFASDDVSCSWGKMAVHKQRLQPRGGP